MTRAQKKRQEMREAIRNAAIREFAQGGLAGTSTQMIAQSAGITKAQLHYYISSKEALYQEVLGHIVSEWREIFFLGPSSDDPREVITSYIRRKLKHSLEYPEISRLFASEIASGAPHMPAHWDQLRTAVDEASAVIQAWIDEGRIAPVDPLLFQINIWAVTQHYAEYEAQARILTGAPEGQPLDATRIINEATQLFLSRCGLTEQGTP